MLALQFVPFSEVESLSSEARIQKLLEFVKDNRVVFLEGSLHPREESELIRQTMESITDQFKGVELSVVHQKQESKLKTILANFLLGGRQGFTIIGPATVVQEIQQHPDSVLLLTHKKRNANTSMKKGL